MNSIGLDVACSVKTCSFWWGQSAPRGWPGTWFPARGHRGRLDGAASDAACSFTICRAFAHSQAGSGCVTSTDNMWSLPSRGFPRSSVGKESTCNAGDLGSMPGLGRSPGEGNGNPFQYPCLENSVDRGVWQAIVHGVAKSQTWLSEKHTFFNSHFYLCNFSSNASPLYLILIIWIFFIFCLSHES